MPGPRGGSFTITVPRPWSAWSAKGEPNTPRTSECSVSSTRPLSRATDCSTPTAGRDVIGWLDLDLGVLLDRTRVPRRSEEARPVSRFPSSDVDLALVVEDAIPAGAVERTLRAAGGELLESVAAVRRLPGRLGAGRIEEPRFPPAVLRARPHAHRPGGRGAADRLHRGGLGAPSRGPALSFRPLLGRGGRLGVAVGGGGARSDPIRTRRTRDFWSPAQGCVPPGVCQCQTWAETTLPLETPPLRPFTRRAEQKTCIKMRKCA